MNILVTAVGIGLFLVLFYFLYQFLQDSTETQQDGLPFEIRVLIKGMRPIIRIFVSPILRIVGLSNDSAVGAGVRSKLLGAGIYDLTPEEYLSMQALLVVCLGSFCAIIGYHIQGVKPAVFMAGCAILVAVYYPYFKISQQQMRRKQAIFAELPYVVDLLSLGIESGLDFRRAVERLVEFSEDTPLMNELKLFMQDLELGKGMGPALKTMAERVDVLAFFSFVEALIQATQMGVDVTPTLRAQAEQMRVTYFQQLEKQANETPLLLLIPTMVCIFPPMIILLLTPAVIRFTKEWVW